MQTIEAIVFVPVFLVLAIFRAELENIISLPREQN